MNVSEGVLINTFEAGMNSA